MKYFIKKTKDYSAKNNLQKLLLVNLGELDCWLFDSKKEAEDLVHHVFELTLQEYKGTAAHPQLNHRQYDDGSGQVDYWVDSVHLSLYAVKNI